MKGALVVPEEFAQHFRRHSFEISGLLQWGPVMGWDVKMINEELSDYDFYMVNFSSTETEYASVLRQINPDAKIVACFDYGFSVVNQYFSNLQRIREVMNRVDAVFSVNKNQQKWMELVLPETQIHYIPHPANVQAMAQFQRPSVQRDGVAFCWHQYDNNQIQGLEVLKAAERRLKKPLKKAIIGLKSGYLVQHGIVVVASDYAKIPDNYPDLELRGKPMDPTLLQCLSAAAPGVGWDVAIPYMGVENWYETLSRFELAVDLYTVNSIGRFGIDCAGVGTPLVASDMQDSSKSLWPLSTVDPFSARSAVDMTVKIISNEEFRRKRVQFAMGNVENQYGFAKSRARMEAVLRTVM